MRDLSHCHALPQSEAIAPTIFNPAFDMIALHYDCAPDPDDFTSAAADRLLLEASYGTEWLKHHVLPVIGTFGLNEAYKEASCERIAQAVWGDSTGYLRANQPSHAPMHSSPLRTLAVATAASAWWQTIAAGGQLYVKEGGQSDFTKEVVAALEARQRRSGKCVHIVQHAQWNEQQNHPGVTPYLMAHADYLGPCGTSTLTVPCRAHSNGRGPITDGNGPLAAFRGQSNAAFIRAANASWMG